MPGLAGKVVAISGAASGIGRGVAVLLAGKGAVLSLADVNFDSLQETAELVRASGCQCSFLPMDLRDVGSIDRWIQQTVDTFGKLDGAVNCAGVYRKGATGAMIADQTDEEWDFVLSVNLTGMFKCLRAQLSNMNNDGSVVNISSAAGFKGLPFDAPYCVSKHGILGLTRTAAKEMASCGIRVNCVAPGTVDTPMLGTAAGKSRDTLMDEIRGHTPLSRMGTTEEVAKSVAFLLNNDESSFTTGTILSVDGGMMA